jgi:putative FmdB family regulatory protein
MIYEYRCVPCGTRFDVIKSVAEIDRPEACEECGGQAQRHFVPSVVYFSGTKVEDAEYNPALGCITKGKRHREEVAKRQGLVEVGNDFGSGESLQKHFESEHTRKREKAWEEV